MASQKSSKTDLLVRVRYQNPLPAPPFPPKLINIPTGPQRYATYDFLSPIQGERELPLILDSELGLPLEYGKPHEGGRGDGEYWMGNRTGIAPVPNPNAPIADEDAFMFEDATPRGAAGPSSATGSIPGTPGRASVTEVSKKVDVSWLRKTEYLSSEASSQRQALQAMNGTPKREPGLNALDRDSRAAAISATFAEAHKPLDELQHPTKRDLRAVEAFELLPDDDLWANEYDLVRFGEDPSARAPGEPARLGPDPRLPRAIFRDLTSEFPEGEGRVSFYLPANDQAALGYTEKRYTGEESAEGEPFDFRWVRDYELLVSRPLAQEYIFSFDAGEDATEGEERVRPQTVGGRKKGAYYVPLQAAMQLRKRRPKLGEDPRMYPQPTEEAFWDGMAISLHKPDSILEGEHKLKFDAFKGEVANPPEEWGVPAPGGGSAKGEEDEPEQPAKEEENGAEVKVSESQSQE
ncbi:RNA polymerase II-associated protein [Rhodotorula toruloides ATCC 204091]|uniref:RNA polymerase II-associated protein n=1 Tax=Rhodotorula toruloides TaxID=5286 RepID=A0A0K3C479_RHOTO|nr:RNA polymerase II-associated protein [Rhodotorula toruloides ATCC 204091]KAK4335625.1 RNA polymerase II-associated protein [Rhodotorula toruloides]PRQ77573.1 RNA polymerase II-associated protein [Rhodotorula toruloides]